MMPSVDVHSIWYPPLPAHHYKVEAHDRPPVQFIVADVGTGGLASESYFRFRNGYQPFKFEERVIEPSDTSWAEKMAQVKLSFGRTMSRLPEVFGVSRQTLYNWLAGETPKEAHQERLRQLVAAAAVFTEHGFRPTAAVLDRTVSQGKSLLELLRDGANGTDVAEKLVRLERRAAESRAKLDVLLAGRQSRLQVADMGAPAFDEEV